MTNPPFLLTPHRYIFVRNDGETFVAFAETMADALMVRNCPKECDILAVVTDRFSLQRKGNWHKRAAKTRFGKPI